MAVDNTSSPQTWADLGCGSGTFTTALANVLPRNSIIHAIDREPQTLPQVVNNVAIRFLQGDFEKDAISFYQLDGILLANSLHYVTDQAQLIAKLATWLHMNNGRFLLVEYDRKESNRWVPYPIPLDKVLSLFSVAGFGSVVKIGERKSRYGQGNMYACVIRKNNK